MNTRLFKKSFIYIIIIILIKLAAVIKDIIIAYYFGDSYQADAFLTAFVFVNIFILFFTNGMRNVFIPNYMKAKLTNKHLDYTTSLLNGTIILTICLVAIMWIISPIMIQLLYPNQATLITKLTQILLLAVIAVSINVVIESYFEANERHNFSAFSQLFTLLVMIIFTYYFHEKLNIYALAYGYTAGTLTSLLLKIYPARKIFQPKMSTAEVKGFYRAYIPIAITVMVGQINLATDQYFANRFGEGIVTYLSYAKNLVHLPQGIIATALATLMLPVISKSSASNQTNKLLNTVRDGQLFVIALLTPAITGMIILMPEITAFLYERGAFKADATAETTIIAYYYLGSVLFYSLNQMIANGLYAIHKGKLIMRLGLISIALNIILNQLLTNFFGHTGIPLASSIVGAIYFTFTYRIFTHQIGTLINNHFLKTLLKIVASSLVMGLSLILLPDLHLLAKIAIGMLIYFCTNVVLKIKIR